LSKRISSPDSRRLSTRMTESFREKSSHSKEKFNRIKFLSALMKISRFRDQPSKITEEDKGNLLLGPKDERENLQSQCKSLRFFGSAKKSITAATFSIISETERYVRPLRTETSDRSHSHASVELTKNHSKKLFETVNTLNKSLERSPHRSLDA
jgi:hypothetical protein